MSKLNYKLVSIALLTEATVLFSAAIFSVAQAQSLPNLQEQINLKPHESSYNFTRDLTAGSKGEDVKALQQFLNSHGAKVSASGPGSPGNETAYFGGATKTALAQWQTANGISPAVGYFGKKSRLFITLMAEKIILPSATPTQISVSATTTNNPVLQQTNFGPAELPTKLKIPKINVYAPVISVGVTADGAMDVPKGPAEVAWFSLGPRPGEIGSAVISGHFGPWKSGGGSVFDNLADLKEGDILSVENGNGTIATFVVRKLKLYGKNDDASDVFGSNDGKAHLNLVTCEGTWDKVNKTYSNRLVVFTEKKVD